MPGPLRRIPDDVAELLERGHGVVHAQAARPAGVHESRLRRLTGRGLLVRLAPGCYASATDLAAASSWEEHRLRARAFAIAGGRTTFLTGWSAVITWKLPTLGRAPRRVSALRAKNGGHSVENARHGDARVATIPVGQARLLDGVGLMSREWAVADIARKRPLAGALVVADAVARLGDDLGVATQAMTGWVGVHRARWVAEHADPLAESPIETLGRFACLQFDLPMPVSNAWVGVDGPEFRVDGLWPFHGVVSEADGAVKYDTGRTLRRSSPGSPSGSGGCGAPGWTSSATAGIWLGGGVVSSPNGSRQCCATIRHEPSRFAGGSTSRAPGRWSQRRRTGRCWNRPGWFCRPVGTVDPLLHARLSASYRNFRRTRAVEGCHSSEIPVCAAPPSMRREKFGCVGRPACGWLARSTVPEAGGIAGDCEGRRVRWLSFSGGAPLSARQTPFPSPFPPPGADAEPLAHPGGDLLRQETTAVHENDSFSRMRPRGRAHTREARAEAAARSLDDAFADYAARFGLTVDGIGGVAGVDSQPDGPPSGDRWSTWDESAAGERGPEPYPDWVITELAAVDTELGVLKTGKEADVFLLERAVPDTGRATLMAAKRYRDLQHRMFHRDAGYLEGRRDKESRINRAMSKRTAFGREAIAGQWAYAEFAALSALWSAGVAVPYPVQIFGTELVMEFIGDDDGVAAPRLAQLRPDADELDHLWEQLVHSLSLMALAGYAHGDLSAYNLLVDDGRLVVIDVPQIVDVIGNPHGRSYLDRDVRNVGGWFTARGLHPGRVDALAELLAAEARLSG